MGNFRDINGFKYELSGCKMNSIFSEVKSYEVCEIQKPAILAVLLLKSF